MKQASINSFFVKRSATASDDLLLPAKKKIKSDSPQPTPVTKPEQKKIDSIKEEDEASTPPIPQSPPSPKKVKFSDDDGGDTEEDEELQESAKKSLARRSQSMPDHVLKAALRTNKSRINSDSEEEDENKQNDSKNGASQPKVDNSKSRLVRQQHVGSQVIQIRQGDITEECTGAIVNAANSSLAHGGGVAGAISRKGGSQIQQESDKWVRKNGTVPSGKVAVTGPGRLPCTSVIHAVGPVWTGGKRGEDKELYSAVWHSLLKAHQMNLPSISIPAISSGIFGFPKDRCAYIMTECAVKFSAKYTDSPLKEIRFTNFDRETVEIFTDEFHNRFDSADSDNEKNEENENDENIQPNTTTTPKNTTKQTTKTSTTTTFSSNTPQKTKTVHNSDTGNDTEEDEDMVKPTGYESSDGERENKPTKKNNINNHDGEDSAESDVEWGKWRK